MKPLESDVIRTVLETSPSIAINNPITKERILAQILKTGNTPFEFDKIDINLDNGLYVNISNLNELRRKALEDVTNFIITSNKREITNDIPKHCIKRESFGASLRVFFNDPPPT